MIHEIRISKDIHINREVSIRINHVLVKHDVTWLEVCEFKGHKDSHYLVRLFNDQITIYDGYLFIEGSDILEILRAARVMGSIFTYLYHRHRDYENQPS